MLAFFQTLVKMSVSSVWIILAVILFRLILRQIPKQARVLMWILPAVRLTVPFSFESRFSVTPEPAKVIPQISETKDKKYSQLQEAEADTQAHRRDMLHGGNVAVPYKSCHRKGHKRERRSN